MGKIHDDEMEIDLTEIFFALRKRVLILLAALLAGAVIAGVYTKVFVTPQYSATSTVLVISKETTLTSMADLQFGSQLTKDYSMLITSRSVLEKVVDNMGLDIGYGALKGSVSINNPQDTRILEISVKNPDPQLAKEIADELADVSSEYIGDKMEVVPPKIIEEAEVPASPVSPNFTKNVMTGGLAGLILAAGVVVLLVLMDDTIKSEDDIERYLGLSTLASIPDRKDFISSGKEKQKSKKRRKRRRRK